MGNAIRFAAVVVWSFACIGLSGYLFHGRGRWVEALVIVADLGLVLLGIAWYTRSLPGLAKRAVAAAGPPPPDPLDTVRGPVRAIVDAELAAGNSVFFCGPLADQRIVRVTLREPFRLRHSGLPMGDRQGWEHYYTDAAAGFEVCAQYRQSAAEAPLLCEHLRPVEVALHRAGARLTQQYGIEPERWLRFDCDLDGEAARARFGLADVVEVRVDTWYDRTTPITECQLYCKACRCGIHGCGYRRFPPAD